MFDVISHDEIVGEKTWLIGFKPRSATGVQGTENFRGFPRRSSQDFEDQVPFG